MNKLILLSLLTLLTFQNQASSESTIIQIDVRVENSEVTYRFAPRVRRPEEQSDPLINFQTCISHTNAGTKIQVNSYRNIWLTDNQSKEKNGQTFRNFLDTIRKEYTDLYQQDPAGFVNETVFYQEA